MNDLIDEKTVVNSKSEKNTASWTFCKNIQYICKRKKIKIGDIERRAGCSAGYIGRSLLNNASISLDMASKLSIAVGAPIADLLDQKKILREKLEEAEETAKMLREQLRIIEEQGDIQAAEENHGGRR